MLNQVQHDEPTHPLTPSLTREGEMHNGVSPQRFPLPAGKMPLLIQEQSVADSWLGEDALRAGRVKLQLASKLLDECPQVLRL